MCNIMKLIGFILTTLLSSCLAQKVVYQWNYLNFTWPSCEAYNQALNDGSYIPENNIITGIKVWKDRLYLTLPRWKKGVPATLASTKITKFENDQSPALEPYPNWSMQRLDDCSSFQYVQSMEIDPLGRMWILDNGRTEFITDQPKTKCPPRLVILDLEKDDRMILNYQFPQDVAPINSVFLNDIVLDHEDGGWAYITDTNNEYPGIIVFSLKTERSWKIYHETMRPNGNASNFLVNGTLFSNDGPVDGIALSQASTEGDRILYYTPLSSYEIYSVPVQVLKNRLEGNLNEFKSIGKKSTQTDGMIVNSDGKLYFGLLTEDSVGVWNTNSPSFDYEIIDQAGQWPDTFAIDELSQVWWTSNRIQNFMTNKVNLDEVNYRVHIANSTGKSYQYYQNGSVPQLPTVV